MSQEKVEFSSNGLVLEGILTLPEGEGPFGVVIVCHPHPLYGGNMSNNVVFAVCQGVGERGLASFAFNFRGVGRSSGYFDEGKGECDDARAAISFVKKRREIDPERVGICGYSFGSIVAFTVAVNDPEVRAIGGLSPFVQPADLLNYYTRPKLFLCGAEDEYINREELERLVNMLPEPKELVIYPGVDHFWWGQEKLIARKTGEFFQNNL